MKTNRFNYICLMKCGNDDDDDNYDDDDYKDHEEVDRISACQTRPQRKLMIKRGTKMISYENESIMLRVSKRVSSIG